MSEGEVSSADNAQPAAPGGEIYDWYQRGLQLLHAGSPGAAASLLQHARVYEPDSASVREALARAMFDSKRYAEAAELFEEQASHNPDDDYAQFGLGLALTRLGNFTAAVEHLAMAVAMRPQRQEYVQALREARATLRVREGGP